MPGFYTDKHKCQPGTVTLQTDTFLMQHRRLISGGTDRMTLEGTGRLIIHDFGAYADIIMGTPKTTSFSFKVPTEYFLSVNKRLAITDGRRVTLEGTSNLILDDAFIARSRLVLSGQS